MLVSFSNSSTFFGPTAPLNEGHLPESFEMPTFTTPLGPPAGHLPLARDSMVDDEDELLHDARLEKGNVLCVIPVFGPNRGAKLIGFNSRTRTPAFLEAWAVFLPLWPDQQW